MSWVFEGKSTLHVEHVRRLEYEFFWVPGSEEMVGSSSDSSVTSLWLKTSSTGPTALAGLGSGSNSSLTRQKLTIVLGLNARLEIGHISLDLDARYHQQSLD
jgi:hypothetical protein